MDRSSPSAMAGLLERMEPGEDGKAPTTSPLGTTPTLTGTVSSRRMRGSRTRITTWPSPSSTSSRTVRAEQGHERGQDVVSSSLIDRVWLEGIGRTLIEVPVGFKWFVPGLLPAKSALARNPPRLLPPQGWGRSGPPIRTVWFMDLLAAEIIAVTGKSPSQLHEAGGARRFGYAVSTPRQPRRKRQSSRLSPEDVTASELAGEPIDGKLVQRSGITPRLAVSGDDGGRLVRGPPSGTEDVYKIYAELSGPEHLAEVQEEAKQVVGAASGSSARPTLRPDPADPQARARSVALRSPASRHIKTNNTGGAPRKNPWRTTFFTIVLSLTFLYTLTEAAPRPVTCSAGIRSCPAGLRPSHLHQRRPPRRRICAYRGRAL